MLRSTNKRNSNYKRTCYCLASSGGFSRILSILLILTAMDSVAATGMHGSVTITSANTIVNEYTYLTSNASSGLTYINVANSALNQNSRFSSSLVSGELIMIIQMQGATITTTNNSSYGTISNYNNSGNFEFVQVASVPNSTRINLTDGLAKNYSSSGNVQVVRVPRYSSFTINTEASVTCPAWDGSTGGIVVIENNSVTTINGEINVTTKGFRGGSVDPSTATPGNHTIYRSSTSSDGAEKGESIAGYQGDYSGGRYGRGAPANGGGGGNSHNAGGGGGANGGSIGSYNGNGNPANPNSNWTAAWNLESAGFASTTSSGGGRGGYSWSANSLDPTTNGPNNASWGGDSRYNVGGFGGRPLDYSSGKIFLGGGGGAGDANNNVGTAGGAGGGIVYLLSGGIVQGNGSINANGESVVQSTGVPGDGCGGGGGGGSIIIFTNGATIKDLTLNANGGTGGSQDLNNGGEVEGMGGGGGGGYISTTNATNLMRNVNYGSFGNTNAPPLASFTANGATSGANGTITTSPTNPYTTSTPLPIVLENFYGERNGNTIELHWTTSSEINNDYFIIEKSSNGILFTESGKEKGAGNSTELTEYIYTDQNPCEGNNFYRLTQVNTDGGKTTYAPIKINFNNKTPAFQLSKVSPNPASEKIEIEFNANRSASVTLIVIGSNGELISSETIQAVPGINQHSVQIASELKRGLYYLSLKFDEYQADLYRLVKN